MGGGVCRVGKGGGRVPQPHIVSGLPPLPRKGQRLKSGGRAGSPPSGYPAASSHLFPKGQAPESPDLLGMSLVAFGTDMGTRPPECICLTPGDLEASRKSLRPTGNCLISGGKNPWGRI